mgnify:CR=1 FL=1
MICSARTDKGRIRSNNEDALYVPPHTEKLPQLYIVADGMGGHQGGEVASRIAVETIASYINENFCEHYDRDKIIEILNNALNAANQKIFKFSLENSELYGMGTTATVALFKGNKLYIGHVGDSRAYRIREGSIIQLTKDHSLVWELMEQGKLSLEETKTHPMKNVITRALGTEEFVKADILELEFDEKDIFLLCSDGLTNMLDDKTIMEIVLSNPPSIATQKLIQQANLKGGTDNITVGIIRADYHEEVS